MNFPVTCNMKMNNKKIVYASRNQENYERNKTFYLENKKEIRKNHEGWVSVLDGQITNLKSAEDPLYPDFPKGNFFVLFPLFIQFFSLINITDAHVDETLNFLLNIFIEVL